MTIKIKLGPREIKLSPEEARDLHQQLKVLFEAADVAAEDLLLERCLRPRHVPYQPLCPGPPPGIWPGWTCGGPVQ